MVIAVGNGHGDLSSNSKQDCVLPCVNIFVKGMNPSVLISTMGKSQNRLDSLILVRQPV